MTGQQTHAIFIHVDGRSARLEPGSSLVVGRGSNADIIVADPDVSRQHVRISSTPQGWMLEDLGSSNGTWLQGRRLTTPLLVTPGMRVQLGGPDGLDLMCGSAPVTATASDGGETQFSRPDTHPTAASPAGGIARVGATHQGRGSTAATAPIKLPKRPASVPKQRRNVGEIFDALDDSALAVAATNAPAAPSGPGTVISAAPQVVAKTSDTISIGRGQENDIVLRDLLASRTHARLTPGGNGYSVTDLNSRNGTFINGQRISQGVLREGDLLAIGRAQFTVKNGLLVASQDEGNVNFVANHISFTLPDGKKLLDDISFALDGRSLVAVIGPSGAGKSTLLKALIGQQKATEGDVFYDGRDLYENYDDLRQRIGVVPQDDVVHHQLTVRQALRYAAELRFPDDLPKKERNERVGEVIEELGLTNHADTQVAKLSGGQRKRTSVALELLTKPSLLFLDEPTSGLDPGLDKRLMEEFRKLADGGRTVVVITHNVASLSMCDRVLLLAPGGKVAYFGPPNEIDRYFETGDYADIFNRVTDDPDRAQSTYAASPQMQQHVARPLSAPRPAAAAVRAEDQQGHRQQSLGRQLSTLVRRQFRAMAADRGFMLFSLLMPIALGALNFLVPDSAHGLLVEAEKNVQKPVVPEARQVMTLLTMGAVFMGLSMTVRELVAERPIYLRERAVGLSTLAYITSKAVCATVLLSIQSAIVVAIAIAAKGTPNHPVIVGNGAVEIFLIVLATALTTMSLGLLLSSVARTSEQVMPMLVITMMGALVFSGVLFSLKEPPLSYLSVISPSRWGMALAGQTGALDLEMSHQLANGTIKYSGTTQDSWWEPTSTKWWTCQAILLGQFVVCFVAALIFTKRRKNV